jgi:hypothetical protein
MLYRSKTLLVLRPADCIATLEGETLAQRLSKSALPIDQALQVAIQIADALDKAHRKASSIGT